VSLIRPTAEYPRDHMLSLLFLLGLIVGIALGVIVVAGVLILLAVGIAWLNAFVIALGRRIRQQQKASEQLAIRQLRRS
jgi:hypothetical protein